MNRIDENGFTEIVDAEDGATPIIPSRGGPGRWSLPEQNLGLALASGSAAGLVGALAWGVFASFGERQVTYLALIGIGFVVGLVVRQTGRGAHWLFGAVAGVVTLGSCLLGMVLAYALRLAIPEGGDWDAAALGRLLEVLLAQPLTDVLVASLSVPKAVFTAAGTYQAFQLGYKRPEKGAPIVLP